jgi:hypothetical protein
MVNSHVPFLLAPCIFSEVGQEEVVTFWKGSAGFRYTDGSCNVANPGVGAMGVM